jgi:hypothetical protein
MNVGKAWNQFSLFPTLILTILGVFVLIYVGHVLNVKRPNPWKTPWPWHF